MPVSCCVPLCTNNFLNSPNLSFYQIPKDRNLQKKYVVLIRCNNLKVQSDNTRICSAHFEGGEKMSRSHLPSIFPWSKKRSQRRALSRMNQGDICKTAKREGKLKEYKTLVAGDHLRICLPKRSQNAQRTAIHFQPPHVSAIGYGKPDDK